MIDKVIAYIEANREQYIKRLLDFLRIRSISTDPAAKPAMKQAAEWTRKVFQDCGVQAEIYETAGHPAVLADTGPAAGGPTILIYGHYDVQPTGDESLWKSPPFEPAIREGRVYARGSADDKGQVLAHILAVEAWKKVAGKLPIRIKFLVEGEEEIGSDNLAKLIADNKERLACDYVCISDTAKYDDRTPAITYGTKGLVYKQIDYVGTATDLHSGSFGGTVVNPGNAIAALVASMKDADLRVTIPGFYDEVAKPSAEELKSLRTLPFKEEEYRQSIGSPALEGEKGYSTMERRWLRPTLDVNGLLCGFTGEGSMTVLPCKAMAKVSMRLVPNQDPEKISKAFDKFVADHSPKGVKFTVKEFTNCAAYMCPIDNPGMKKAMAAIEAGFGVMPALIREGGSLPILPLFKRTLGAESIMIGLCLPNCNAHGPNEFMVLDDFQKGIATAAHLAEQMGRG